MLMLIKIAFFLFAFLVPWVGVTQPRALLEKEIIFDDLPKELGLSQRTINCILQDDDGLLWIGTWSGLIRYDGYSTQLYNASDKPGSLKSNKITHLAKDEHGVLWIGTRMGDLPGMIRRKIDLHNTYIPTVTVALAIIMFGPCFPMKKGGFGWEQKMD